MFKFVISMIALVGMICIAIAFQAVAELTAEHFKMEPWSVKIIGIIAFCIPIAAAQAL